MNGGGGGGDGGRAGGAGGNARVLYVGAPRVCSCPVIGGSERQYVWQCVEVCCSVLQCVAVCCSVLQWVAVDCSGLQCVLASNLGAPHVSSCPLTSGQSVLQCAAACCSVLQWVAVGSCPLAGGFGVSAV